MFADIWSVGHNSLEKKHSTNSPNYLKNNWFPLKTALGGTIFLESINRWGVLQSENVPENTNVQGLYKQLLARQILYCSLSKNFKRSLDNGRHTSKNASRKSRKTFRKKLTDQRVWKKELTLDWKTLSINPKKNSSLELISKIIWRNQPRNLEIVLHHPQQVFSKMTPKTHGKFSQRNFFEVNYKFKLFRAVARKFSDFEPKISIRFVETAFYVSREMFWRKNSEKYLHFSRFSDNLLEFSGLG